LDLSILIVSYNTCSLTLECLAAVFRETRDVEFEVIVVDNASADGSAEAIRAQFPQVRLIASPKNLGFAAGNNHAASFATGSRLLLLNPDTVVLDRAVDKIHRFAKTVDAIVGGRTLFADGALNPSSCWGKPTPWSVFCLGVGLASVFRRSPIFDPESLGSWDRKDDRPVDVISGCFLLLERSLWDRLGGFDLDFFMYGEDFDLCLRAAALGAPCWVCSEAEIIHYGGASERVRADKMVRLFTARTQLYRRHWPKAWHGFGERMHDAWAGSRFLAYAAATVFIPRLRESRETWRGIWQRRAAWHAAV
jgi:N-acetylglucosaminyl-diphospho-decaprenol L-rhamnosyltransferase